MLYFSVDHQRLKLIRDDGVINESQDYLWAEFNFTADWDAAIKVVQFYRGNIQFPEQHLEGNRCKVPWEALVDPAPFMVTVIGHNKPGEANLVITTNAQAVEIKKNGQLVGIDPAEPTKGVYGTKLAETLEQINNASVRAVKDIDIAETNAKVNIEGYERAGIKNIKDTTGKAIQTVNTASDAGVELVESNTNTAVSLIGTEKETAVREVNHAKSTALQEVASSSEAAANNANNAKLSAGEAANSASNAAISATEAGTQAVSAASSATKAEQEANRATMATDGKADAVDYINNMISIPLLAIALGQAGEQLEKVTNRLKEYESIETGRVTLNNSEHYPFNNSKTTLALKSRRNKNYIVLPEVESFSGGSVGEVQITDRLTNGFKLNHTGSAKKVTVFYTVLGGV